MTARPLGNFFTGIAMLALLGTYGTYGQTRRPTPSPDPPTTTPTTPGMPGTTTRPGTGMPGQTQTPNQFPQTDMNRPIFLSGKVMLSDGNPPPESVAIERVCGPRVLIEGMTDRKGRFSFQLGQNTNLFMDASSSEAGTRLPGMGSGSGSGPMNRDVTTQSLMTCELRASLPGFRSETVSLAMRRSMDNPDVGTIILHRMGNVEGLTISATSVNAPKEARKAFEKGHELLGKGKLDDARKHLEKAVEEYPKYAAAWNDLGIIRDRQKDTEGARKAFEESIAADAKFVSPYDGLAQIAARSQNWQDVADITDRIIRLNRYDFPRAFFMNAVAKLNLKKLDEAEKSANELIELDTRHQIPRVEQVLGVILAQKQDFTNAAVHIRRFIELAPESPEADTAKKQLAALEKTLAAKDQ